jgi:hypothetical protein
MGRVTVALGSRDVQTVCVISAHSAIQWGDVPTWLASALTGLSLLIAMVIIWRDRQSRLRAQAMQIACWGEFDVPGLRTLSEALEDASRRMDGENTRAEHRANTYTVHIANNSPMPINQPMIFTRSITKLEARRRRRWKGGPLRRGIMGVKPPKDRTEAKIQLGESGRPADSPTRRARRTHTDDSGGPVPILDHRPLW